jgi:integrase/recombinase XerD
MTNDEFLEKFSRKIISSGGDYATAKTYRNNIGMFMDWGKFDHVSVLLCDQSVFENYIIFLRERKLSPSSINSFIASAKRLYKIFSKKSKTNKLEYHDNPLKTPNILTHEECMSMCNSDIYIKHKAVINLLYYGALRRREILNLKIEDISKDRRIVITKTKFRKSRVITIPQYTLNLLREYYIKCKPKEYLFNGEKNKPQYSEKSVENIIKNTAKICKINKTVCPRIMRASRATHLLDNGAYDMYVSEFLGHEKLQTTKDYYCKLTIKGMQNNFDQVDEKIKKESAEC